MFKKKVKKEQGVLTFNDEAEHPQPTLNPPQDDHPDAVDRQKTVTQPAATTSSHPPFHSPNDSTHPIRIQQDRDEEGQANPLKRAKNYENQYPHDAEEQLQNEPQKKNKENPGTLRMKGLFASSTASSKERLDQAIHEAFQDRNFKAGKNLIQDLDLAPEELEEELAKRRFLQNVQATKLAKEGKLNTKIYRGMNSYASHKMTTDDINKAEEAYKKKMGPSRLNSTIKNSCRFDYVLNLCKDWHDSGYCPFGNSCLYLHDRSNVKTGWELEKDFEQAEKERWRRINNPDVAQKEDREKLLKTIAQHKPPEECPNCNKPFVSPVQVECGHLYCTPCALKLKKCKDCGKRLGGIMNNASEKLAKRQQQYMDMVAKLDNQQEQTQGKRRKFQDCDALDVFAD